MRSLETCRKIPLRAGTSAFRGAGCSAEGILRRHLSAILLLALAGCASATAIPDADRARLQNELAGQPRFLRVSMYQGRFWEDPGKLLLSVAPPEELQLFTDAHGNVVPGPKPDRIIPAGRMATITRIELPTGMVIAGRMPYTPRYNPWVYLHLEGDSDARPSVLVLRGDLKSHDDFLHALDRLLSVEDPKPRLAAYSEEVRQAIAEKRIVREMDPAAVEMAWGVPAKKSIDLKGGNRTEVWSYASGKRTVTLVDGKVARVDAAPEPK